MVRTTFGALVCSGALMAFALADAQEQAPVPAWQGPLQRQMLQDEHCAVAFIGEVVERVMPGKYLVRAKVTCEDQRVYTVEQTAGPGQPFRIVNCSREGPSC